jgi:hypothetical protein
MLVAARAGDRATVLRCLDEGVSVNACDKWGRTVVSLALERKDAAFARDLIVCKFDPTLSFRSANDGSYMQIGIWPLRHAIEADEADTVQRRPSVVTRDAMATVRRLKVQPPRPREISRVPIRVFRRRNRWRLDRVRCMTFLQAMRTRPSTAPTFRHAHLAARARPAKFRPITGRGSVSSSDYDVVQSCSALKPVDPLDFRR